LSTAAPTPDRPAVAEDAVIRWGQDGDGIVTLTIDDPAQRVNTLNERFTRSFAAAVDRLYTERHSITGVVLTSGKPSFLAGGDLRDLFAVAPAARDEFLASLIARKARTRRLELLGRPVVAVVSGAVLGGGFELALACHHRIAVTSPRMVVGLPEVTLGLLPGGGGVVRLTRLLGPAAALPPLLSGTRYTAAEAMRAGMVDELAPSAADAAARARRWILAHPDAAQLWDRDDAALRDQWHGTGPVGGTGPDPLAGPLDPARRLITRLVRNGLEVTVDQALLAESEGLADLVISDGSKATMQVVFFDTVRIRGRLRTPRQVPVRTPVLTYADAGTRALLAGREFGGEVDLVDLATDAGRIGGLRSSTGHVVFDLLAAGETAPRRPGEGWLHADRVGDGGLVLEYQLASTGAEDALSVLARHGILPVALAPGRGSFAAAFAAGDSDLARATLRHPEDFGVAAARIGGAPAWLSTDNPGGSRAAVKQRTS
jgi:3-hydroxyacyl-CoA dehydrogenase/enoyl-CoA hydratase/3-hydroxybutyryl-CoA epimerase